MAKGSSVAELVATQAIRTDKAEEERLHFTEEGTDIRIGATFHEDDAAFIFDNFAAFQDERPTVAIEQGAMGRFRPNLEDPLVKKRRQR